MPHTSQTFKNHARLFPPYHYFVLPVLLLNFLNSLRHIYQMPSRSTGWEAVVAVALLMLAVLARVMVLTVQDRVIRLEMRLRLHQLLPVDLQGHIAGLTPKQLVALRFACDAELPGLVREVVAGNLSDQKTIKQRVKDWQADYLRA